MRRKVSADDAASSLLAGVPAEDHGVPAHRRHEDVQVP
jgi:hypothetical protein